MARRVLVIEDDPAICRLLERGLSAAGFEVSVAADLTAGRAAWETSTGGVVVLDVMLPDGDGLELAAMRRAAGDRRPVIVLTAREDEELRRRAAALEADYLPKPFAYPELLDRIRAALQ